MTTQSIDAYQTEQEKARKKKEEERRKKKQTAKKPEAKKPATPAPAKDIFSKGLPAPVKEGDPTPSRITIIDQDERNSSTTISAKVTYQVLDQYGNPYTGPGAGGSEAADVLEEIVPLPSVCEIEGCDSGIRTSNTQLDADGQFTDTLRITTAPSAIRIPDNTSIRSLQRISIIDITSGREINLRLNLIEINRNGVNIQDITNTGTNVPRK
jgi:hypothetical protein